MSEEQKKDKEWMDPKEELGYVEYQGNRFLIDNGVLKDVLVEDEKVRIPDEVREIRRQAFLNARLQNRMEMLYIPSSVKRMDRLSFAGIESLETVEILPGITTLEPGTFRNCTALVKVVLPDTLLRIESRVFENCVRLTEVRMPVNQLVVSEDAFSGCLSLNNEQIEAELLRGYRRRLEEEQKEKSTRMLHYSKPMEKDSRAENVEQAAVAQSEPQSMVPESDGTNKDTTFCIRDGVLERCEIGCRHIVIPEGVKKIGPNAFSDSEQKDLLEKVELPKGMEAVERRAFYGLRSLQDIVIPSSVSYFGAEAFEGTAWLFEERKKNSCVCVNGVLISAYHETMVLEAKLPDTIYRIAPYAFYRNGVQKIRIPDSVRVIDACAFAEMGVTEIEFPNHGKLVLHNPVFVGCNCLKELLIPESIERIDENFAENCAALQVVCLKSAHTAVNNRAFPEHVRIWVI